MIFCLNSNLWNFRNWWKARRSIGATLHTINFNPLNAFAKGVLFAVPGTHLEQLVDGNFLITEHYEQPGQSP